ncbi:MAG: tandem-95 repeat protein [Anaerolineales bacterium]|nr:tandem-95 repeat protein [Anaerolineales bacterium]
MKHHVRIGLMLGLIILLVGFMPTGTALAATNDNTVQWDGAGHAPGSNVCGEEALNYRYPPANPSLTQSVVVRARSYQFDLTGITLYYTINASAAVQGDWTAAALTWEANCGSGMDSWKVNVPAQATQVWYKFAYTDGTDTDWVRASGEGAAAVSEDEGGWATASTTLTYTPQAVPTTVYVDDDFDSSTPGWGYDHFATIQNGIDAVASGGTVNVAAGTYSEAVTVNKDITLQGDNLPSSANAAVINGNVTVSTAGATVHQLKVVPGNVTANAAGIFVSASNTTITGNLIADMTGNGSGTIKGIHIYNGSAPAITNITVAGNTIQNLNNPAGAPYGGADGIMVQGVVDTVIVTLNGISNITSAGWAYGIEVTPTGSAPTTPPQNVTVTNNIVGSVNPGYTDPYNPPYPGVGLFIGAAGANPADAREVVVLNNAFSDTTASIASQDAAHTLTATCNWFDDISGPAHTNNPGGGGGAVSDGVSFAPWMVYNTDDDGATTGWQLPAAFTVTPVGDVSEAENDFRVLANAISCVQSNQTITLDGTFDWDQPYALGSWALGADGSAGNVDDYWIMGPQNTSHVTITASSLGDATVQGPGDLGDVDMEGFFGIWYGTPSMNQYWTISNLQIYDFDVPISFYYGGGANQYLGTTIDNNHLRVAQDLNGVDYPNDQYQNIGIHLAYGKDQTISNNIIDLDGGGTSHSTASPTIWYGYSSEVALQSNTHGGDSYDGLQIINNTVNVLNAQDANYPARLRGLWENGHAHSSDILVSGNTFTNLDAGNDPDLNQQAAFRVTSHSSASTTVTFSDNNVEGANVGFSWLSVASGLLPVIFDGNVADDVAIGVALNTNGNVAITDFTYTGTGNIGSIGVDVVASSVAAIANSDLSNAETGVMVRDGGTLLDLTENFVDDMGTGVVISATATLSAPIFNNSFDANTLVISNLTGSDIDASGNWLGSNDPALTNGLVSAHVDYTPWLDTGSDTSSDPGFQGDFDTLWVDNDSPQTGTVGRIQEGVDMVSGSTVYVAAGTYQENILVDTYVEIIGAGSGDTASDTIVTTPATFDSKVGVFQIAASGLSQSQPILLQDMRLLPVGQAGVSVGRFTEATGTNVSYLLLDNIWVIGTNTNPSTEQERGLYVDLTSTLDYLTVVDSAFNNLTYGWYFQKHVSADTSTVSNVVVTNTIFNHNNHKGIYAEKLTDATFTDCTISENGFDGSVLPSYFVPWMAGVDINLKAGTYQNIAFINPAVTDNALGGAKEGVGLTVKARSDGSYSTYPATLDHVLIANGTFTGNERGIRVGELGKDNSGPTNVVIRLNRIYGNLQTYSGTDGSAYGGVVNQSTAAVLVENNWWGCNEGPAGTGGCDLANNATSGSLDADPWLVMNLSGAEATADPGATFALTADLTDNSDLGDTTGDGYLPETTLVGFTPAELVDPDSDLLTLGLADTQVTLPVAGGDYILCTVLDNETVCSTVTVETPLITWADDDWVGLPDGTEVTPSFPVGAGVHIIGYDAFDTIQEAIGAVADPGTTYVMIGAYPEIGQIAISKDLTLIGEDRDTTIVQPTANTGGSGDARGWFLVNAGVEFNISGLTLDGAGYQIMQGIRSFGTGTIANNVIQNIAYPGYDGLAVVLFENMTVMGNTFSNIGRVGVIAFGSSVTDALIVGNTYTGKGAGDWLDYAIELGGGAVATIEGNTITNNLGVASSDGSTSAAILITTYFGAGTQGTILENTLLNNTSGISIGYDGSDTSTVVAAYNRIVGNEYAITSTAPAVMAENNWFGCNEGPGGVDCDPVDALVDADPWLVLSADFDPLGILISANGTLNADLIWNSDDVDTSAGGFVPDTTPALFNATNGSFDPEASTFTDGETASTYTAPATAGADTACIDVDNEQICFTLTVLDPLALTDLDLWQSTDQVAWEEVPGSYADGFTMVLDPAVEWYYLDSNTLVVNRPLADGYHPFYVDTYPADFFTYWAGRGVDGTPPYDEPWQPYMWEIINGNEPIFYLLVAESDYTLVDGLTYLTGGGDKPLRINGSYLPGTYTYTGAVADEYGYTDDVTVEITFNDLPVAHDQTVYTDEDLAVEITLTATDLYPGSLTWDVGDPAHGTLSGIAPDLTYTPDADWNGTDNFTFTVNDGELDSNIATVTIIVAPVNDDPVAVDDEYTTDEDTVLTVPAPGVLANDEDVDEDNLSTALLTPPVNGQVSLMGDGSFEYIPNENFFGTDTFTYQLVTYPMIRAPWTDEATVTITVNPVNDDPTAEDQAVTTPEDIAIDINLVVNDVDGDTLTWHVGAPDHGILSGTAPNLTYTPDAHYYGPDSFTFYVNDETVDSNVATVTITISPVNDAPEADDQTVNTDEDTAVDVTLTATDVEGSALTWQVGVPVHGALTGFAPHFTYTPDVNWNGTDTFTFTVNDGDLDSNIATVTIHVGSVNDDPLVNAGADLVADEGSEVAFSGAYNDPGLHAPAAVEITWNFGDGAMVTGTLTPTHSYGDNDTYTVTLTITDELGGVGSDWLLVTVANVAPELSPIADLSVKTGEIFTVTAAFLDAGWLDVHTLTVAWSDGLTETIPLPEGTQAYPLSHAYTAAGTYTVTVTLLDDDGGMDELTFEVLVAPAGYRYMLPMIYRSPMP